MTESVPQLNDSFVLSTCQLVQVEEFCFNLQADAQAKKASESAQDLARVREQLTQAAAEGARAQKALEEEQRNGAERAERLENERKELADARAEYDRRSAEMIASLRAVEEAFEEEKEGHRAEKEKLREEIADLRWACDRRVVYIAERKLRILGKARLRGARGINEAAKSGL